MKLTAKGYEQLSDILVKIENQAVKGILYEDAKQSSYKIKALVFDARQLLIDECLIEQPESIQPTANK